MATLDDFVKIWKDQDEVAELAKKLHENQLDKETSNQYWVDFVDKLRGGEKLWGNEDDPERRAHFSQNYHIKTRRNEAWDASMPKTGDIILEAKGKIDDADKYAEIIAMIEPDKDNKAYEAISKAVKTFNEAMEPIVGKKEDRKQGKQPRADPAKLRKIMMDIVNGTVDPNCRFAAMMKELYEDDRYVQADYAKMIIKPARENLKKAIETSGNDAIKAYATENIGALKKDEQMAFFNTLYANLE